MRAHVTTLLAVLVALGAAPAAAEWGTDGALLSAMPGVVIAPDGRGGVYGFAGYAGTFPRMFRLGADGDTVSGWPLAGLEMTPGMTIIEHNSVTPVAAMSDGAGGSFILAYEQTPYQGHGGALYPIHLYLHRRGPDGRPSPEWATTGVQLETTELNRRAMQRRLPIMASDGRGGALIAWLSVAEYAWPYPRIVVQRVAADGELPWGPEGIELPHGRGACTRPALAADGRGGALVFWGQWDSLGTRIRMLAQHVSQAGDLEFDLAGRPLSAGTFDRVEGAVPLDGGWQWQYYPPALVATPDGVGGAIVCWTGAQGADLDVWAARFDERGRTPWWRDVIVCDAPGEQASIVSVPAPDGGAVVAWRDGRLGDDVGLYAQAITRHGRPMWDADGVTVFHGAGDRGVAVLARDGRGGTYIAWPEPTGGGRILAQRVLANGRRAHGWPADGAVVSREAQEGRSRVPVQLVEGERGTAIVGWTEEEARSLAMVITPDGPADSGTVLHLPRRRPGPRGADDAGIAGAKAGRMPIAIAPQFAAGRIRFTLPEAAAVSLAVFDLHGRRVATLLDGAWRAAGAHELGLEAVGWAPGVYLCRLEAGGRKVTGKLFVTR